MAGVGEVITKIREDYGEQTAVTGDVITEAPRIPTGIFPLDLALGGGIPEGRVTEIYGAEGSCKTNLAMKAIASKQKMHPHLTCAIIDIENTYDKKWAKMLGVDVEKLYVVKPDYGEQAVDMVEALLNAEDIGIVLLDSLAAMITTTEAEKSAEAEVPGGLARCVKKMINKSTLALRTSEKEGRTPTFIIINQIRHKIGVMYGSPETQPGGFAPKFAYSLRLRNFAKGIFDKKISTTHDVAKELHVVIQKHKIPIVCKEAVFNMCMVPHNGMQPGFVDDWNTLWAYMKLHGIVAEAGKNWTLYGEEFKTQKAIREKLAADPEQVLVIKSSIIKAEVDKAYTEDHKGG